MFVLYLDVERSDKSSQLQQKIFYWLYSIAVLVLTKSFEDSSVKVKQSRIDGNTKNKEANYYNGIIIKEPSKAQYTDSSHYPDTDDAIFLDVRFQFRLAICAARIADDDGDDNDINGNDTTVMCIHEHTEITPRNYQNIFGTSH